MLRTTPIRKDVVLFAANRANSRSIVRKVDQRGSREGTVTVVSVVDREEREAFSEDEQAVAESVSRSMSTEEALWNGVRVFPAPRPLGEAFRVAAGEEEAVVAGEVDVEEFGMIKREVRLIASGEGSKLLGNTVWGFCLNFVNRALARLEVRLLDSFLVFNGSDFSRGEELELGVLVAGGGNRALESQDFLIGLAEVSAGFGELSTGFFSAFSSRDTATLCLNSLLTRDASWVVGLALELAFELGNHEMGRSTIELAVRGLWSTAGLRPIGTVSG